jgi:hypothetical protein
VPLLLKLVYYVITIIYHCNRQPQEGFAAQYQRGLSGGGYKTGYYSHGLTVLGGDSEDVTAVTTDVVNRSVKTVKDGSAEDLPCLKEAVTLVKFGSAHLVRACLCHALLLSLCVLVLPVITVWLCCAAVLALTAILCMDYTL